MEKITPAEWHILSVLWEHEPLTPGEVSEYLLQSRNWTISTVKTLISRLLKKGLLNVDRSSRYPKYSTVYSEEDCVENEISNTIKTVYGDSVLQLTEDFSFFGYASDSYITKVSDLFHEQYEKVKSYFSDRKFGNRKVLVHRSSRNFYSAMGIPENNKWIRIGINYDMIHLCPEVVFKDIRLDYDITYMLTYALLNEISMELPYYFKQGLSYLLSVVDLSESIRSNVNVLVENANLETLMDIVIEKDTYEKMRMRDMAFLFVQFISCEFGENVLKDIVYEKMHLSRIISKDIDGFILKWKQFILQKYGEEGAK